MMQFFQTCKRSDLSDSGLHEFDCSRGGGQGAHAPLRKLVIRRRKIVVFSTLGSCLGLSQYYWGNVLLVIMKVPF